jgi:hypothetical protein
MAGFLGWLSSIGAYSAAIFITPVVGLMSWMFRLGVFGKPLLPDSPQGIVYSDMTTCYRMLWEGKWPPLMRTDIRRR